MSPSNPTGSVYPRDEIEAIGRWALEHGVVVITDEIYEHLVYDGHEHHSILAVVPELADQCIILNGVAKTYAMTGWRVGWMIAPADVVTAVTNLQSHLTSNVANVSQRAALAAVSGDLSAVAEMRSVFDRRRRVMHGMLQDIPGVTCLEPQGAFYAFPNLTGLLGVTWGVGPRPRRWSWRTWCWRRPRWPSCPARPSTRPATAGSRSRSVTRTWRRASPDSSASPQGERRSGAGPGVRPAVRRLAVIAHARCRGRRRSPHRGHPTRP